MIQAVYDRLSVDTELMGYLSGGLYLALTVGELSRQNTEDAFDDNQELLPVAIIRQESGGAVGPYHHSGQIFIVIYLYQRFAYAAISPARERIYTLLHRARFPAVDGPAIYQIFHTDDLLESEDEELAGGASMEMSRYQVFVQRS